MQPRAVHACGRCHTAHKVPTSAARTVGSRRLRPTASAQPGNTDPTPPPPDTQPGPKQKPAAAAYKDAEDEPLWWQEKFEARRKQQQQQQQQQQAKQEQQQAQPASGTSAATGDAAAAPQGGEQQQQQQEQEAPQQQTSKAQLAPWPTIAVQLGQLLLAVAALILWPASLYAAGLASGRVWWAFLTYALFFGGGSAWRLVRFGPLAPRARDKQGSSAGTRAAWLAFVAMMPILHWGAVGGFLKRQAALAAAAAAGQGQHYGAARYGSGVSLYDVLGLAMMAGAVALNWAAARHLGRAYDRVVRPEALVTSGPYAHVQHPLYSSYMLLFCGCAMWMHSLGYALLAAVVCLVYYGSRVRLEAAVLQAAFGAQYEQYSQRTKLFVPYVM